MTASIPFGRGSMLEVALLAAHVSHLTTRDELASVLSGHRGHRPGHGVWVVPMGSPAAPAPTSSCTPPRPGRRRFGCRSRRPTSGTRAGWWPAPTSANSCWAEDGEYTGRRRAAEGRRRAHGARLRPRPVLVGGLRRRGGRDPRAAAGQGLQDPRGAGGQEARRRRDTGRRDARPQGGGQGDRRQAGRDGRAVCGRALDGVRRRRHLAAGPEAEARARSWTRAHASTRRSSCRPAAAASTSSSARTT